MKIIIGFSRQMWSQMQQNRILDDHFVQLDCKLFFGCFIESRVVFGSHAVPRHTNAIDHGMWIFLAHDHTEHIVPNGPQSLAVFNQMHHRKQMGDNNLRIDRGIFKDVVGMRDINMAGYSGNDKGGKQQATFSEFLRHQNVYKLLLPR